MADTTSPASKRVGVLISGRGSNLQALIEAIRNRSLDATIAVVISNKSNAAGLERARLAGIEALFIDPRKHADRSAYDSAIVEALRVRAVDLVCLAGFMRLVGAPLLDAFPNRVVNIHPSLLPAFPGLNAQQQALNHGVRVSGATVHLVNGELDAGPIVLQAAVPVLDDDTEEALSSRILVEEHRLYPAAVQMILNSQWRLDGRRFVRSQ